MRLSTRAERGPVTIPAFLPFVALWALVAILFPLRAHAQQFAVDDASITEPGACQVEGWWGEAERFFLPACSFLPNTEITLGAARLDRGIGRLETHGIVQAKWMRQDPEAFGWGWGFVVGTAVALENAPREASEVYAYIPVTRRLEALPLDLHANVGWVREAEPHGNHSHTHHGAWLGLRGDLTAAERLHLIGEVFGVVGDPMEAQVGVRVSLKPDRVGLDLSYGFLPLTSGPGLGWQLGLAWAPAPFRP